jgi:hypothetical protein
MKKPVTICVLTHGDHAPLVKRALNSIIEHTERAQYTLVAGANAVADPTREYLEELRTAGHVDTLVMSEFNLGKCPMMRRMFEHVQSEFVWWFDDDSYVTEPGALETRLRIARSAHPRVVMWGERYLCNATCTFFHGDPVPFVRSAPWYRGLTPPFWEPGGKGEFDFNGEGTGNGQWVFLTGGGWFARFAALRAMDWPDPRISTFGEDVLTGEAIRQQGWEIQHIGQAGVELSAAERRWNQNEDDARAEELRRLFARR